MEAEPKLWRDMTPEEKGALLLAAHEGKVIEMLFHDGEWQEITPQWALCRSYRVRPEPVRKPVSIVGGYKRSAYYAFSEGKALDNDEYRITFDTIDGVPDCASVKMEQIA